MMWTRKLKFAGKAKTALYLLTATGLTFSAVNHLQFSRDSSLFPEKITGAIHGVLRTSRAVTTIAFTVADYKFCLRGLPDDSDDYLRKLSEVHLRSAKRILKLCEANKGFYIKAGQFVATLRQVPKQYSSILSSLQDQAVPYHFEAIKEVLTSNLGHDLSEMFLSFDEKPIAAASIAQVHRALLRDHQEVAVKVQYPGLERQMKIDTTTMSFLSKSVAWMKMDTTIPSNSVAWFFPNFRFGWLVSEFVEAISLELDFIQEARNSERAAKNFRNNSMVRIPHIFWGLTTRQVLTMQFCSGHKVDDIGFLKENRVNPIEVARAIVEVFAEMIFIHGFVHGDPHPGNILVSPEGPKGFSLVLLDHGIYKLLDEGFRKDFCELWKALILLDSHKIQWLGERFGVGKYSRYFPVIFIGRTIDSKPALGRGMSTEEKWRLKQELKSLKVEDISSFMESLPPDFLTILRTDGLLRSLVSKLGAPQQVRLLAYAKYAVYGLYPRTNAESYSVVKVAFSRSKAIASYLQLRIILEVIQLLHWMEKLKQLLGYFYRGIFGAAVVV